MDKISLQLQKNNIELSSLGWQAPKLEVQDFSLSSKSLSYRFYRIDEIIEEKAKVHRLAMSNVIACMNEAEASLIYMLSSDSTGVSFYLGIAGSDSASQQTGKLLEQSFAGNFLGARLKAIGSQNNEIIHVLTDMNRFGLVSGIPSFNEAEGQLGDEEFQGVERLVNSLAGEAWRMIIVAEPGQSDDILRIIENIYNCATDLSSQLKYSVQQSENRSHQTSYASGESSNTAYGTNTSSTSGESSTRSISKGTSSQKGESHGNSSSSSSGSGSNSGKSTSKGVNDGSSKSTTNNTSFTEGSNQSQTSGLSVTRTEGSNEGDSVALTRERTNKQCEEMLKHLSETQLQRFRQGHSKGMFRTAFYLCAEKKGTFERLSQSVLSIFQGNQASMTPLRLHVLENGRPEKLSDFLQIHSVQTKVSATQLELVHSISLNASNGTLQNATWLNGEELALLMGLPGKELPGIKIRKSVNFALNVPVCHDEADQIKLGKIVQHGKPLDFKSVHLRKDELNKHMFITGVTGSGKTTTCMKLLLESGLPFLVIEPAKTEYRALYGMGHEIQYYTLGREDLTPFRLNPFELVSSKENLSSHIDILKNTLNAVFPMEAAMPYIVEEAIIKAYEAKGWNIHTGDNWRFDDPFAAKTNAWPNFSDMIAELDGIIAAKKMGQEFTEKYRGSLVARLSNLTLGTKGRMLNCRKSINFDQLLDQRVVIELDEIKDENDKALFMGFLITRFAECIKQRHARQHDYRHLTLIEEAHRLLSKPEPTEGGSKKLGVDMFCNLLAEVRKYGQGLIIADQIPNKLVTDVIKNTNIKIVHRLFSADDREVIGDTMCLDDKQKNHLPMLQPGEAVIFGGGWHAPVLVQVERNSDTNAKVIDEAEIQKKGQQQIWASRDQFYPHLAECRLFNDANSFTQFQRDARKVLSVFIKLLCELRANGHSIKEESRVVRQQLHHRTTYLLKILNEKWLSHLGRDKLIIALAAHFFDETSVPAEEDYVISMKEALSWLVDCEINELVDLQKLDLSHGNSVIGSWRTNGFLTGLI